MTQSRLWFALYTRHQHEKGTAKCLAGKGIEVFLPLYKTAHRWKDRIKQLSLPLFPNYVFVCAGIDQNAAILRTPGVYNFVRFRGRPSPIPGQEIEAVKKTVDKGLSIEPHPFLNIGDRVRAKSGPLEGVEGILVSKKGFYRLVLSVNLLARSIAVEVDAVDFERVSEGRAVRVSSGILPNV
ncbi:MAG: UpxY family transcription antiterminator [Acidobacteriota bacterium]